VDGHSTSRHDDAESEIRLLVCDQKTSAESGVDRLVRDQEGHRGLQHFR
jgi:hypothetical protein